ncbi:MAG: AAA family ATPase [Chlorobi bacterium]|nr:AAA family ATPase [Chlorobiota bacterium]
MNNIEENVNSISQIFKADKKRKIFKKYIDYIRFPFFKNFNLNLKVNFDFPITFLVGQNGSGKSSLLQALYGAPLGYSIESYWYTTALDPIKDLRNNRHCFIYSFLTTHSKTQVEVLKERIQNKDKKTKKINPDYWEPARPKVKYGMDRFPSNADARDSSKTRWDLLKNDVLYMDFRYSLSAYDKYFYFGSKPTPGELSIKKDIIRKYAPKIKSTFDNGKISSFYSRKSDIPVKLSDDELKAIQYILGKNILKQK